MIENMTNEQAAECLKTIIVLSFKDETATFFLTDVQNAFKLAIKALEQQPYKDWLSTFNTESATACFTAVQELKKRVDVCI